MLLIATVDPSLRNHVQQTLTEKDDSFLLLEEGDNIVDLVCVHRPSLLILDLYLTNPSGLAILRQLRTDGYSGKVVALGGPPTQTLTTEATHLGVLQIMGRPFSANQVLGVARMVNETLDHDPESLYQKSCNDRR